MAEQSSLSRTFDPRSNPLSTPRDTSAVKIT